MNYFKISSEVYGLFLLDILNNIINVKNKKIIL